MHQTKTHKSGINKALFQEFASITEEDIAATKAEIAEDQREAAEDSRERREDKRERTENTGIGSGSGLLSMETLTQPSL